MSPPALRIQAFLPAHKYLINYIQSKLLMECLGNRLVESQMFWKDFYFTKLVWDTSLQSNNFSGKPKTLLLLNCAAGGEKSCQFQLKLR